ncbi:MAG: VWA domain-containing protein [Hyphomicrobiales bacterium]
MSRFLWVAMAMALSSFSASAAETMIVFDASGSMWGQINGKSKIEMARDAFANLENTWIGRENRLGLIAYGHRRKGDCGDIETLVEPTIGALSAVSAAVENLRPKGKTPLSAAVKLAAQKLGYQEAAATVILFSDGIETCNADPCALADELAREGIDFTAHVIGFGLTKKEDRAQLQCIANNTGGQYFDAKDANGVADALGKVSQIETKKAVPIASESKKTALVLTVVRDKGTSLPVKVTYRATHKDTRTRVMLGTVEETVEIMQGLYAQLPVGDWTIEALSDEGVGQVDVSISGDRQDIRVPFAANIIEYSLADNGPYQLGMKHDFYLFANKPIQPKAQIPVALFNMDGKRLDWETRFGSKPQGWSQHDFKAPKQAGEYEIIVGKPDAALARFSVTFVDQVTPKWMGATQGEAGGKLPVKISGMRDKYGKLYWQQAGEKSASYGLGKLSSPEGLLLPLPSEDGEYELIYNYKNDAGKYIDQPLSKIKVGKIVLADDADAVAAPTEQAQNRVAVNAETDLNLIGLWKLVHGVTGELISSADVFANVQANGKINMGDVDDHAESSSSLMGNSQKLKLNILALEAGQLKIQYATEFGNAAALMSQRKDGDFEGTMMAATGGLFLPVKFKRYADIGLSADEHGDEAGGVMGDYVFICEQEFCTYDDPETGFKNIPLRKGFGLIQPTAWKTGRPNIQIVNLATNGWAALNRRQVTDMVADCIRVGTMGHHEQDEATATDSVCISKDISLETFSAFEDLEVWVVRRNYAAQQAAINAEFKAMGGEEFAASPLGILAGNWILRDFTTNDEIMRVQFSHVKGEDNADSGSLGMTAKINRDAKGKPVNINMNFSHNGNDAILVLSRPPEWAQQKDIWYGAMMSKIGGGQVNLVRQTDRWEGDAIYGATSGDGDLEFGEVLTDQTIEDMLNKLGKSN